MVNIPNALTLLRALGVPAFLYLFLIADQPIAAFIVIAIGGLTDYLDGKLARALNQSTEFGAKFDPVVDRLYITAVVLALASREYLPWALVIAILARDLIMALLVAYQRLKGFEYVQVSLLLKDVSAIGPAAYILGWAFAIWGIALYFYTAFQYLFKALVSSR
jgi:cardiolipin synthase